MSKTFTREVEVRISEGDGRTLVSRLVPYNEVTTVNDGGGPYKEEFLPGAFSAQMRAANRIKAFLNFRHRQSLQDQIGYAQAIEDRTDGLHGELRVLENPDGDKALQLVEAGMLDRLSIEFEPLKDRVVDGVVQRVKARLVGVALVPQGAYAGAQVLGVREEDEEPEDDDPPEAANRQAMPMGMESLPDGVSHCTMAGDPGFKGGDRACHTHDGSQDSMMAAMTKAKADAGKASGRSALELPPPLDVERLERLGMTVKRPEPETSEEDG